MIANPNDGQPFLMANTFIMVGHSLLLPFGQQLVGIWLKAIWLSFPKWCLHFGQHLLASNQQSMMESQVVVIGVAKDGNSFC